MTFLIAAPGNGEGWKKGGWGGGKGRVERRGNGERIVN